MARIFLDRPRSAPVHIAAWQRFRSGGDHGRLAVNLGGLLDLNGFNAGVGGLNGGRYDRHRGRCRNVHVDRRQGGGGNGAFSGTIRNSSPSGMVALVKAGGNAEQVLSGTDTYSGGTTLSGEFELLDVGVGGTGSITFNGGTLQYASGNWLQDVSSAIAPIASGLVAAIDTNGNSVSFGSGLSGTGRPDQAGRRYAHPQRRGFLPGDRPRSMPAPCSLAVPRPSLAGPCGQWRRPRPGRPERDEFSFSVLPARSRRASQVR